MEIRLRLLPFTVCIEFRRWPLHFVRPRFTFKRSMLYVMIAAVSLAWVDFWEREQAFWLRSHPSLDLLPHSQ
jgi:hypothetical protein